MYEPLRNRPPTQEIMLLDLVRRLAKRRRGTHVVWLHLSKLSPAYNRSHYLKIAANSFSSTVSGMEGHLFTLEDGDLVFVAKDATPTILDSAVERVKILFSQDPLCDTRRTDGQSVFCSRFDMVENYDDLLSLAQEKFRAAEKRREEEAEDPFAFLRIPENVSPDLLTKLEQALENVDVTNVTRRQSICTLIDDRAPQPLFEEIFVSIEDLQKALTPGVNLATDVWLFRYLTRALDVRIMNMLVRDGISTTRPFSININVSTVLAPAFARFENVIAPQLKGRLVVEMNALDVFSDMNAFLFARDYLHDHGFRLCLDGLTHHTLPYYDRARLGFDLVKLFWTPTAVDTMPEGQIPLMRRIVMETGQAHSILCRCDDARAVKTGQDLGIVMFQGRYIDGLLAPKQERFI